MSIDSSFRLPVLIAYLALVIFTMFWPADKNLAELIALSAALLVASQFWYLDKGGTLVMLYLPLAIAMMFRPTVADQEGRGAGTPAACQPSFTFSLFLSKTTVPIVDRPERNQRGGASLS